MIDSSNKISIKFCIQLRWSYLGARERCHLSFPDRNFSYLSPLSGFPSEKKFFLDFWGLLDKNQGKAVLIRSPGREKSGYEVQGKMC